MKNLKPFRKFKDFSNNTKIGRSIVICVLLTSIISTCSVGMASIESGSGDTIGGDNLVVVVKSISITADGEPVGTSIVKLHAGDTKTFDVEATFSDGTINSNYRKNVKWQSTIDSVSVSGEFTSSETGIGTITAIYGSCFDTITVEVIPGDVDSIFITSKAQSYFGVDKNTTIPFGLVATDDQGNQFLIEKADWSLSNWHYYDGSRWTSQYNPSATITQTGVISLYDIIIGNGGNKTFNSSGHLNYTGSVDITAAVSSTINAVIRLNMTDGNDTITIAGPDFLFGSSSTANANVTEKLIAVYVLADNNWDFGSVYPGTATGWTRVTFRNAGTCRAQVKPDNPGSGLFRYLQFRDDGTIYDIGDFTVTVDVTPLTDAKGHIVSFSPEHKEVEMRLNPPVTYDVAGTDEDSIYYTVMAI
jgi:hypothetical protein